LYDAIAVQTCHHDSARCDAQGRFRADTMNERRAAPTGELVRVYVPGLSGPALAG
jgi:hypothetical protein